MSLIISPYINSLPGGLLTPVIYQNIISNIIAPHGITDLTHSIQENKIKELLSIYSITNMASYYISYINNIQLSSLLDISFLCFSIIHFRHDMPIINNIPKYVWSCLLLYTSIIYNYDIFIVYMCISHLPNHYLSNWNYIKHKWLNSILILVTTISCHFISHNYLDVIMNNIFYINIIKSIIMSHIIYQELYIKE